MTLFSDYFFVPHAAGDLTFRGIFGTRQPAGRSWLACTALGGVRCLQTLDAALAVVLAAFEAAMRRHPLTAPPCGPKPSLATPSTSSLACDPVSGPSLEGTSSGSTSPCGSRRASPSASASTATSRPARPSSSQGLCQVAGSSGDPPTVPARDFPTSCAPTELAGPSGDPSDRGFLREPHAPGLSVDPCSPGPHGDLHAGDSHDPCVGQATRTAADMQAAHATRSTPCDGTDFPLNSGADVHMRDAAPVVSFACLREALSPEDLGPRPWEARTRAGTETCLQNDGVPGEPSAESGALQACGSCQDVPPNSGCTSSGAAQPLIPQGPARPAGPRPPDLPTLGVNFHPVVVGLTRDQLLDKKDAFITAIADVCAQPSLFTMLHL